MLLPHLPQRQIDTVLLFAAVQRWPPPFTQVPTSGLLLLQVEFPHFVHFQFPIICLLLRFIFQAALSFSAAV
jgi:hypothetical protein